MLILAPMFAFNCAIWPAIILVNKKLIPGWSIGVVGAVGIGISWLIWSILVTKWKIWAFSKVSDIKELKKRAIRANLIWEDDSVFTKTEIWSKAQKENLHEIEKRFDSSV